MVAGALSSASLPVSIQDEGGGFAVYDSRGRFLGWFSDRRESAVFVRRLMYQAGLIRKLRAVRPDED